MSITRTSCSWITGTTSKRWRSKAPTIRITATGASCAATGTFINRSQALQCPASVMTRIGWVEMIGRLPWSLMIFEGHENDTDEHNQKSFDVLRKMTRFEVAEYGQAQDGDSESRAIAILIRK